MSRRAIRGTVRVRYVTLPTPSRKRPTRRVLAIGAANWLLPPGLLHMPVVLRGGADAGQCLKGGAPDNARQLRSRVSRVSFLPSERRLILAGTLPGLNMSSILRHRL